MKREAITGGLGIALGLILGLSLGWKLYRPAPVKPETPASAARQADGSLVLERAPDSAPGPAPHLIPNGGREERRIRIIVKPRPVSGPVSPAGSPPITSVQPPSSNGTACPPCGANGLICPPVAVDLSLVRMPDKSRRVVASSPDGEVIGGVDIPIERRTEPRPLKWAAGATYDPIDRTWGGFVNRDLGPFRLGVEAHQERPTGAAARVMVGVRW